MTVLSHLVYLSVEEVGLYTLDWGYKRESKIN